MDEYLFRKAMGMFSTGVTVLTTEVDEQTYGMTANAFMSVSLEPKLVVVSIGHKAKFLDRIRQSGKYAVNILSEDQEQYSRIFAGQMNNEVVDFDKLANQPVIKGALAQVACEVVSEYTEGDHTLFVGKVVDINLEEGEPLIFFGGKYRELTQLLPNKI